MERLQPMFTLSNPIRMNLAALLAIGLAACGGSDTTVAPPDPAPVRMAAADASDAATAAKTAADAAASVVSAQDANASADQTSYDAGGGGGPNGHGRLHGGPCGGRGGGNRGDGG